MLATPIANQTVTNLNFSVFLSNGTYAELVEDLSFWEENKTMIISVTAAGIGIIILVVLIFILVRWNRTRVADPEVVKTNHLERA